MAVQGAPIHRQPDTCRFRASRRRGSRGPRGCPCGIDRRRRRWRQNRSYLKRFSVCHLLRPRRALAPRRIRRRGDAWRGPRSPGRGRRSGSGNVNPAASRSRIEQAVRAITGRLTPQLPPGRRFRRTLLFGRGRRSASRAAAPIARIGRYGCGVGHRPHDWSTLELKMRPAIAIRD